MAERFSSRESLVVLPPITLRSELPESIRLALYDILRKHVGAAQLLDRAINLFNPFGLKPLPSFSGVLAFGKDEDTPDAQQFKRFVLACDWFQLFDLAEDAFAQLDFYEEHLADPQDEEAPRAHPMQRLINKLFIQAGVGWKMENGAFVVRGEVPFESTMREALNVVEKDDRKRAYDLLHAAIRDLSLRPAPQNSDAIYHSVGALESVARSIAGEKAGSLGDIIKKHPELFPAPLNVVASKIWGFASEYARHISEGKIPSTDDAEFVVSTAGALVTYLSKKSRPS